MVQVINLPVTSSPLEILIPSVGHSTQTISLDGRVFTLEIKWNSRNKGWYLNLWDAQQKELFISGIKVVPNQNLTGRYRIRNLTRGNLFCLTVRNTSEELGRDNFGPNRDYSLFYMRNDIFEGVDLNGFIQL